MTWPVATKNAALDGVTIGQASLHSGFPGATGANELTGGSYARQNVTFGAGVGGIRSLSASVAFAVPAGNTVRFVGVWDGAAFRGYAPNGGATPRNFMSVAGSDIVTSAAHGYPVDQKVVFIYGTPPGGINAGQTYYVRDAAADTFKVSATLGGAAINLTAPPSFGCVVCAITETAFPSGGTHTLSTAQFVFPD